jgi:hypothetical protein
MAALIFNQLLAVVAPQKPRRASSRSPRITRQIHKPNMLVVLDTSGSLTGVPGGSFDYSDEVGVDCDDGVMCRGGVSVGTCGSSGKGCSTDTSAERPPVRRGMPPA